MEKIRTGAPFSSLQGVTFSRQVQPRNFLGKGKRVLDKQDRPDVSYAA